MLRATGHVPNILAKYLKNGAEPPILLINAPTCFLSPLVISLMNNDFPSQMTDHDMTTLRGAKLKVALMVFGLGWVVLGEVANHMTACAP